MAVSVAILYAGRWFGRAGQHFVDNHLDYLIRPAQRAATVSVFLVVSPDQWCAAAGADDEASLAAKVAQMFGPGVTTHTALAPAPLVDWSEARVAGTVSERLLRAAQRAAVDGGGKAGHASAMKYAMLLAFMRQFGNVTKAEELRRRSGRTHDMVIKARIDVQYLEPVEVLPLWAVLRGAPAAVVFAPRVFVGASDPEIATPQWCAARVQPVQSKPLSAPRRRILPCPHTPRLQSRRDWNLVLSEAGAAAVHAASGLGNGSAPLYNASCRCYGYCVEE